MKICVACGMPMTKDADYAMHDPGKDYCVHCCREDGTMQSFEEKKAGMTEFIIRTQGFDRQAAAAAAEDMMRRLPAWQAYFAE